MFLQHVIAPMQNSCRYLVILTSVYSFFLGHQAIAVPATRYYPADIILLNCGWSGSLTALDDRRWMGDVGSKFISPQLLNQTSVSTKPSGNHGFVVDPVPYMTSRFSHSQFTYIFHVKPGRKFIRLHFFPASFPVFKRSKAFFSVKAGPYTLLSNFSSSLNAEALGVKFLVKEFSININENQRSINITFIPSSNTCEDAFAFINGIEIVSMLTNLSYTRSPERDSLIKKNTALEAVHRLNVGGSYISPNNDSGMFRRWLEDTNYLLESGVVLLNTTLRIRPTKIPIYIAPAQVYRTARSVVMDKESDKRYNLTWKLPVDPGFKYLVRLHFCAFQSDQTQKSGNNREFHIYINNETAEARADVIVWSGGDGVPIFRDYVVSIHQKGKSHLFIALVPNSDSKTRYSEATLNGLEIFKLNKSDGSLAVAGASLVPPSRRALQQSIRKSSGPSPHEPRNKNNKSSLYSIRWSILCGVALLCLLAVIVLFRRWWMGKIKKRNVLPVVPEGQCRRFSLAEIQAATNNFSKAQVIGEGGFGRVFKGHIEGGETPVAIKGLEPTSQQGAHEFWTEIEMLSRLRHLHLVSLIGYCNHPQAMILVYDYMAQGSLRDHLYRTEKAPLPWKQRLEICIGAARGLNHLHQGSERKIIHRDIKTTNILLDEKWVAKVSDFGLCKVGAANMSKSHITTDVKGTFGYLDPEYFWSQKLTEKSDVYAFGVVLFEVLSARPPVDMELEEEQQSLAAWAKQCVRKGKLEQIIDPFLAGKIAPESLKVYVNIAYRCVLDQRLKRPKMCHVLKSLVRALELQQSADDREGDDGADVSEKLDDDEEVVYFCSTEIDRLTIPSRAENKAYTCPAIRQRSSGISPKVLIRCLSDMAGIQQPRPSSPSPSQYQRVSHDHGQAHCTVNIDQRMFSRS